MPRIARVVVPGVPHHVIQRGNRRQTTFFRYDDYLAYIDLMAEWTSVQHVDVWGYSLMPNHVHLVMVPETEDGLRLAVGEAHRRYTCRINKREGWTGHLWQGRFASYPMDERYLMVATRYIELNPVRSYLVERAETYWWSSAAAHLSGQDDTLVKVSALLEIVDDWGCFLSEAIQEEDVAKLRRHESTGRPLGNDEFIAQLEKMLGRVLRPQKPGPKPKARKR